MMITKERIEKRKLVVDIDDKQIKSGRRSFIIYYILFTRIKSLCMEIIPVTNEPKGEEWKKYLRNGYKIIMEYLHLMPRVINC